MPGILIDREVCSPYVPSTWSEVLVDLAAFVQEDRQDEPNVHRWRGTQQSHVDVDEAAKARHPQFGAALRKIHGLEARS